MTTAAGLLAGGSTHRGSRHFGAYVAIVTDIVDRDRLGRIEVSFPWLGDANPLRSWATLLSPYADDDQGIEVLPEVGTQVVVVFEQGDLRRPYVVGAAWNGRAALPEEPTAANNLRLWQSRTKSRFEFDDADGAAKVTISMRSGHKIVLEDAPATVTISHQNGCTVTLTADGRVEIQALQSVDVSAPLVNVKAAMSKFDGVVKCTTLIADAGVVSPSYTPGAGNVW